jgi:hypothetical protein
MASAMTTEETAYRAELRRCVSGPADAKEACIDQAIAKHSRS